MSVTISDKRDFVDMISLKVLRWVDNPELSRGAPYGHKVLVRGRQEGQSGMEP